MGTTPTGDRPQGVRELAGCRGGRAASTSMDRVRTAVRATTVLAATCCLMACAAATAVAETKTFLPTGAEQQFAVPAGVTRIHVIAVGARGGTGQFSPAAGGFGAVAIADIPATPGQILYVNVGTNGANGTALGAGGFNGGGDSGSPAGAYGGGGGGASDVRTISRAVGTTLFSRLVTAAGGGGSGAGNIGAAGGDAGEAGGDTVADGGGPGTATAGGAGGLGGCDGEDGQRGVGGDSVGDSPVTCTGGPAGVGGGGGGGLYGGGGGGTSSAGGGGGGGSSGFAPEATNRSVETDSTGSPAVSFVYSRSSGPGGSGASNEFSFGKAKKNKRKGTAKLTVIVPGPGDVELAKTKKVKGDAEHAEAQGSVKLAVKPRGKAKRKLNDGGKAKVAAEVTYTPDGGEPNSESKKVKLVRK